MSKPTRDAECVAEAILRKIAADWSNYIRVERHERGGISALIDSSWFSITPEEAEYLDTLRRHNDGTGMVNNG